MSRSKSLDASDNKKIKVMLQEDVLNGEISKNIIMESIDFKTLKI